jgi:hypothetical protein
MDSLIYNLKRGTGQRVGVRLMKSTLNRSVFVKIGIVICLFNIVFTPLVGAVTSGYDESFFSRNDILFYNPDDNSCSQSSLSSSAASLTGNTNAERVWNWLKSQGLSSEQAAGVMGNMSVESASTFSPTIQQIGQPWPTTGWGLVQWTGGRRTAIASSLSSQPALAQYYASKYGGVPPAANGGRNPDVPEDINIKLLDFELNYMMQESQGRSVSKKVISEGFGSAGAKEWDTLKLQKTIETALVFWHDNFEVSGDTPAQVITNRGGRAIDAFNNFSGSIATSSTGNSSASTATACSASTTNSINFNGGNFSETVKAYAWPDYKGSGFTQKMPAYLAAIEKAKADGRYVGNDGVDCGGFVTTLMVDSGFDPTYNNSGKGGPTGVQQAWLDAHWDNLGNGKSINTANLKPGDVAMLPGHTFVYVGHIDGFNSVIASASNGVRAPMAGTDPLTASNVTWYRKKG